MTTQEITEKLTSIFRKTFSAPTLVITNEMTAADVEKWDSLSHMLMISDVEEAFGVKFKLRDLNKMKSVGDLLTLIETKLSEK